MKTVSNLLIPADVSQLLREFVTHQRDLATSPPLDSRGCYGDSRSRVTCLTCSGSDDQVKNPPQLVRTKCRMKGSLWKCARSHFYHFDLVKQNNEADVMLMLNLWNLV